MKTKIYMKSGQIFYYDSKYVTKREFEVELKVVKGYRIGGEYGEDPNAFYLEADDIDYIEEDA